MNTHTREEELHSTAASPAVSSLHTRWATFPYCEKLLMAVQYPLVITAGDSLPAHATMDNPQLPRTRYAIVQRLDGSGGEL